MSDPTPKRLRKTKQPCQVCGLHQERCICSMIPRLDLATRLTLVVHAKELKRTTNSGRLAVAALLNSGMRVRGLVDQPLSLGKLLRAEESALLFYPSEDAIELTSEFVKILKNPIHLIVPDGSWRQASKVHTREPELKDVVRVKMTSTNSARHHLRREHRPEGMSTLEAVARAMAIIEGPQVGDALLALYQAKLKQTLVGRGVKLPIPESGALGSDLIP